MALAAAARVDCKALPTLHNGEGAGRMMGIYNLKGTPFKSLSNNSYRWRRRNGKRRPVAPADSMPLSTKWMGKTGGPH